MPDQMRLQVYLAKCGIASRRKCEEIIAQGRVSVNGKYVLQPGTKVTDEDHVTYDGRNIRPAKQKIYIALHKPSKYLCSTTDPDDRPLAIDLITPIIKQRLFYVGRLDYLTSGLIFFTNDGEFSKKMTHPSTHIEKEYVVTTKDEIPLELMEEFKKGIYVQGEHFKMKDYEFKGTRCVHIILEEGKNRELRKVFLSRNVSVKKVHRIRIGCVDLKGIHSGHLRKLTDKEVRTLLKAADAKGDVNNRPRKKGISHIKTVEKQLGSSKRKKEVGKNDQSSVGNDEKANRKKASHSRKSPNRDDSRNLDRRPGRDDESKNPRRSYNKEESKYGDNSRGYRGNKSFTKGPSKDKSRDSITVKHSKKIARKSNFSKKRNNKKG